MLGLPAPPPQWVGYSTDLCELRDELLEWEQVYNTVRPHQALGYVTPLKFLEQWKEWLEKRMCH